MDNIRRTAVIVIAIIGMVVGCQSANALDLEGVVGYPSCRVPGAVSSAPQLSLLEQLRNGTISKVEDTTDRVDIIENDDGTYTAVGPAPLKLAVIIHQGWTADHYVKTKLDLWITELQSIYEESGVGVKFVVGCVSIDYGMPDYVSGGFYYLKPYRATLSKMNEADLVVGLTPKLWDDSYCGLATLGNSYYGPRVSMSACNAKVLAHEIGHNLGIHHAHANGYEGRKGYCLRPYATARDCYEGTILSYAGTGRLGFLANKNAEYKGVPLGTDDHDAVGWLNKHIAGYALAWEIQYGDNTSSIEARSTLLRSSFEQTIID